MSIASLLVYRKQQLHNIFNSTNLFIADQNRLENVSSFEYLFIKKKNIYLR